MRPYALVLLLSATIVPALPAATNPANPTVAGDDLAERVVVPLSDPGKPARLELELVNGGVTVEAWEGKEVVVRATSRPADDDNDDEDRDDDRPGDWNHGRDDRAARPSAGMKRIAGGGLGLAIEEERNVVTVENDSWQRAIDLVIQVPAGTTLHLSCVNDGDIVVHGVTGEMELANVNGAITVDGAAAPVVAETVNGDVVITWKRLETSEPLAFSTLNGDIDLTLPASFKAEVAFKTQNGDLLSDFDVALSPSAAKRQEERSGGRYRVTIEKAVRGTINGGGPELRLETFNGSIYLRKAG
jgi:hypothetical protein